MQYENKNRFIISFSIFTANNFEHEEKMKKPAINPYHIFVCIVGCIKIRRRENYFSEQIYRQKATVISSEMN